MNATLVERKRNKHNRSTAENERDAISKEQNDKTDVQSNNTLDDDIHQCMANSLVEHKVRDTISTTIADIDVDLSQVNNSADVTNATRKKKKKKRKDNDTEMDVEANNATVRFVFFLLVRCKLNWGTRLSLG